MENFDHTPAEIMDLLQSKPFETLNAAEYILTQKYLTEAEYRALFNTIQTTTRELRNDEDEIPNPKIRENLIRHFAMNKKKNESVFLKPLLMPVVLWKAAAVFILLFGITYFVITRNNTITKLVYIHDTVSVEASNIKILTTEDTLKEHESNTMNPSVKDLPKVIIYNTKDKEETTKVRTPGTQPLNIGIRTMDPADLKKEKKYHSGKSMGEDSLSRRFTFVRI